MLAWQGFTGCAAAVSYPDTAMYPSVAPSAITLPPVLPAQSTNHQVGKLHQHDRQEVVPHLQALLDECQAAQTFTRDQLATDQKQLWEMPAMHLAPHRACECLAACDAGWRQCVHICCACHS